MSDTQPDQKAALWAQLQEIQNQEMEDLKSEREALDMEKEAMTTVGVDSSDIIEINAGGEIIHSHRSTLCLAEGSMFSNLFTGRWDGSCARDAQGRVFLDHDPELIKVIVNHLRLKKIEDPSKKVPEPSVLTKKDEFVYLLRYFGLFEFFYPPTYFVDKTIIPDIELVQPGGNNVRTRRNEQGVQLIYENAASVFHFTACKPSLSNHNEGCSWKVTVDELSSSGWLFIGVIGNLGASQASRSDSTCFGWGCGGQVYKSGANLPRSEWTAFEQGECLHFCLHRNRLCMFSVDKNRVFVIKNVAIDEPYIHFNFHHTPTKVTLSPLGQVDSEILLQRSLTFDSTIATSYGI